MRHRIGFGAVHFAIRRALVLVFVIISCLLFVTLMVNSFDSGRSPHDSSAPIWINFTTEFVPAYGHMPEADDIININDTTAVELNVDEITQQSAALLQAVDGPSSAFIESAPSFTPPDSARDLPECSRNPSSLQGKMKQSVLLIPTLKEADILSHHHELRPGGEWRPVGCRARQRIAVIIPFRDRRSHLNRLLEYLIPMLERQLLDFRFIVTEQYGHDLFNKGRIMNAAFIFAERLGVECVIFHDVDLFPQDDRNFYVCLNDPLHLGAFVNTLGYELWYNYIAGGVLAIRAEHYRKVNGYSNMFWAWGGEDDDMGKRILANNFTLLRPEREYSKYTMLKHIKRMRTAPKLIHTLLADADVRWVHDGLNNSLWRIVKILRKPLYYHLYVDVGVPPNEWRQEKT